MSQQQTLGKTATTAARDEKGNLLVTYHSTVVVKASHNGILLNTGGWKTATTKTRMNQASNQYDLGYRVFQKDYEWFVTYQGETLPFIGKTIWLEV